MSKIISISIDEDDLELLDNLAKSEKRSRSNFIVKLLYDRLEENKKPLDSSK